MTGVQTCALPIFVSRKYVGYLRLLVSLLIPKSGAWAEAEPRLDLGCVRMPLISAFRGEKSIKYDKLDEKPRSRSRPACELPISRASPHLKFGNFEKRFW